MPIRVTCPKCHTRFNVSEKFAGKEGPCPKCDSKIKVPSAKEQVTIHSPAPKGAVDSTGQSVLKPIRRKETKLTSVQITLIICAIVGFLLVSLLGRVFFEEPQQFQYWMLAIGALVLAGPLVFVAYSFLRDQDREGYWGNDLWGRVGICSVVYALSWLAFPVACFAFYDSYETGTYIAAGVAMFGLGTAACMICFEFDWLMGSVHYGLYMGIGLLGRFLSGVGTLPVNPPGATTTTTTTTTTLLDGPVLFQQIDLPLVEFLAASAATAFELVPQLCAHIGAF